MLAKKGPRLIIPPQLSYSGAGT